VKSAINSETGEEVAIKILDKEKIKQEDLGESIKKEISFENPQNFILPLIHRFLRDYDEDDSTPQHSQVERSPGK
jgi:hypothetical protein